ncbi:MAG: hypothetical protein IKK36_08055 [Bacteroidales bacterium]|nr:hypothetical protein [Bacteroidales bacterium]MBR6067316.1 hypothetical protein [Bacteroidales bacterium]
MRKPFWLLGIAALMATLVSCNRNAKPEPAVYELEVYKTQKIVLNAEDRDLESEITLPEGLVDIDGKDALVFYSNGSISYYDLETGKKMSGVSNVEPKEPVSLDTMIDVDVPLLAGDSKQLGVRLDYDETNNVYWAEKSYDTEYYGKNVHELIIVDKDFNYMGTIYDNKVWPWFWNGRILIDIEHIKDNSVVMVNFLKLTKTDRDYKEYIDSCRADLEKKHNDWEEYKEKNSPENSPLIGLVKPEADRIYKVLTLYCKDEISDGEKMVIDSLIGEKEIVNLAPIYLVISAENEDAAASYVKKNGLDCIEKIVFDTEGIAKTDAGQDNPRFMFVEDGLITRDTIYSTQDIGTEMIPRLFGEGKFTRYYIYDGELVVAVTGGAFIDD